MYSDIALQLAIKFNELSGETQILIMQLTFMLCEVVSLLYINKLLKR